MLGMRLLRCGQPREKASTGICSGWNGNLVAITTAFQRNEVQRSESDDQF